MKTLTPSQNIVRDSAQRVAHAEAEHEETRAWVARYRKALSALSQPVQKSECELHKAMRRHIGLLDKQNTARRSLHAARKGNEGAWHRLTQLKHDHTARVEMLEIEREQEAAK